MTALGCTGSCETLVCFRLCLCLCLCGRRSQCREAGSPSVLSTMTTNDPWLLLPVEGGVTYSFEVQPCVAGCAGGWRGIASPRSPACRVTVHEPEVAPGLPLLESVRWSEESERTLVPVVTACGPSLGYVSTLHLLPCECELCNTCNIKLQPRPHRLQDVTQAPLAHTFAVLCGWVWLPAPRDRADGVCTPRPVPLAGRVSCRAVILPSPAPWCSCWTAGAPWWRSGRLVPPRVGLAPSPPSHTVLSTVCVSSGAWGPFVVQFQPHLEHRKCRREGCGVG